ncbi:MAG: sugar transferase [Candidatus Vogelbacteria bacterium]|nr:sugar transferase [Candidatus Vogelbacteria bacterium]
MTLGGKQEALILFLGDLVFFTLALWLTLAVRYFDWPSLELFLTHFWPFIIIFLIWTLVFFISDLYRKQTLVFESALPATIWRAQIINSLLAGVFFYFIPYFRVIGFAPRFNLLLDLLFSFVLVLLWRQYGARLVYRPAPLNVMFDCVGGEVAELKRALTGQASYRWRLVTDQPSLIVYDKYQTDAPTKLTDFYRLLFKGVGFIGVQDLYEEVFGRVPLSLINEHWFLEKVSNQPKPLYDLAKRLMDLVVGLILGLGSLALYPVICLAIKLEDHGPIFYVDERIGRNDRPIKIYKFRSMSLEAELSARRPTSVGQFLRRTRLDELPQLWSVVSGAQSLVGPRPEKSDYVKLYREEVPFYDVRHLIAPGLSGWAQIYQPDHPHFTTSAAATREKLSYDLYYVKNRSLWLDITIGLKTVKALLSRTGI